MGFLDFLKKKKNKDDLAQNRREFLLNKGRITDGIIIESEINEEGDEVVHYHYFIHGVKFESSELLTEKQRKDPLSYAPGASVGIRFDPKNHGNSILV
jgi:hypothetical protein